MASFDFVSRYRKLKSTLYSDCESVTWHASVIILNKILKTCMLDSMYTHINKIFIIKNSIDE